MCESWSSLKKNTHTHKTAGGKWITEAYPKSLQRGKSHHVKWWNLFYLTLRVGINLSDVIKSRSKDTFNIQLCKVVHFFFFDGRGRHTITWGHKSYSPGTNSSLPRIHQAMKSQSLLYPTSTYVEWWNVIYPTSAVDIHLSQAMKFHSQTVIVDISLYGMMKPHLSDNKSWHPLKWGNEISFSYRDSRHQPTWNDKIPFEKWQVFIL